MASTGIHLLSVLGAVLCKPKKPELICSKWEATVLAAIFAANLSQNSNNLPLVGLPTGYLWITHTSVICLPEKRREAEERCAWVKQSPERAKSPYSPASELESLQYHHNAVRSTAWGWESQKPLPYIVHPQVSYCIKLSDPYYCAGLDIPGLAMASDYEITEKTQSLCS